MKLREEADSKAAQQSYNKNVDVFKEKLESLSAKALERAGDRLEAGASTVEDALRSAIEELQVGANVAAAELSERDAKSARMQIKANAQWWNLKIDATRKAAGVEMSNQAAQMSAANAAAMRNKQNEFESGGLLQEYKELNEKLQADLKQTNGKLERSEAMLGALRQQLQKAEERATFSDHNATRLQDEITLVRTALGGALRAIERPEGDGRPMPQQVAELVNGYEGFRKASDATIQDLREHVSLLTEELQSANADAKTAAERHTAEVKRLTETMADRLKLASEAALRDEQNAAQARLQKALDELNGATQRADKAERSLGPLQAEISQLKGELADLTAASKDVMTLRQELSAAKARHLEYQDEVDDCKAQLEAMAKAMAEAEIRARERADIEIRNAVLKAAEEEAARAAAMLAAAQQEGKPSFDPEQARRALDAATKRAQALQEEIDQARTALAAAVPDAELIAGGFDPAAGVPMITYIDMLTRKLSDTQTKSARETQRAQQKNFHLQKELNELTRKLDETSEERAIYQKSASELAKEVARLTAEMASAQRQLAETLAQARMKSDENLTLSAQIDEMIRKYREAEAWGVHLSRELHHATASLDAAAAELERVQQASKAERDRLVRLTVDSLNQLRSHLTFSLSGLRTTQQSKDPHEMMAWKRASGLVEPHGDTMDVVVRFLPAPRMRHIVDPAERSASASAHRHHRFDPTAFSPRPSQFYDDGAPQMLGPVKVSPPGFPGSVQGPQHVTPHGTLMHTDVPASARLLAISRPGSKPDYTSMPAEQHRWGHTPDHIRRVGTPSPRSGRAATAQSGVRVKDGQAGSTYSDSGLAMMPVSARGDRQLAALSPREPSPEIDTRILPAPGGSVAPPTTPHGTRSGPASAQARSKTLDSRAFG